MTTCRSVRERFLDRLTDGLSARREVEHADHLSRCEACRDAYADLVEAWALLPESEAAVAPPGHVRNAVLARARKALFPTGSPRGEIGFLDRGRDQGREGRGRAKRPALRWLGWAGLMGAAATVIALLIARAEPSQPVLGSPAPELRTTHVATGAPRSLSDYRGELVLLNVWATWCIPCEREMASLERLERRLRGRGLRVLAVSVDRESRYRVRAWAEARGLSLTLLHEPTGRLEERYQLIGVPETFIIAPDGTLLWRDFGPRDWDAPPQVALVQEFLERERSP